MKMRKILIIALGLASLATLGGVQLASAAQNCVPVTVCDQWAEHNGKPRCFSAHVVCAERVGSSKVPQPIQQQKLRSQN